MQYHTNKYHIRKSNSFLLTPYLKAQIFKLNTNRLPHKSFAIKGNTKVDDIVLFIQNRNLIYTHSYVFDLLLENRKNVLNLI